MPIKHVPVTLHGWAFSPYLRAVRIALEEKEADYALNHISPFDLAGKDGKALTPFGKVPVLEHGGLRLFETAAILRYVDEALPGPHLQPQTAAGRADVTMLIGLAANHFYPSAVMGVFFQEVYIPANGGRADEEIVTAALSAATPFLEFVEDRLGGFHLTGEAFTLADGLLAAMMHNFALAPSGRAVVGRYPRLTAWFERATNRSSMRKTEEPVPLFGLPA